MEIERIGVYHSSLYYKDFVYVEAKADNPTGLYKRTEESIQQSVSSLGYAWEEYAEFDGHLVSREEYDDGATVIDGKVV